MKHLFCLCCLLFLCLGITAQNQTLGLRIKQLSSNNRNYSVNRSYQENTLDFDLVWGNQINQLIIFYRLGLSQRNSFSSNSRITTFGSTSSTLNETTQKRATYKFSLGAEKRYQYQKLNLYAGLEIPLQYQPVFNNVGIDFNYIPNTTFISSETRVETSQAPNIYYGLNLLGRIYYQLGKISIGIDLSTGITYQYTPSYTSIRRTYEDNVLINESNIVAQDKIRNLRLTSNYGIGLQYHFSLKKKQDQAKEID